MWSLYTGGLYSLYAGSVIWKVNPWGHVKCGLYKPVVFYTGGL